MVQLVPMNEVEHRIDLEEILSYITAPKARARAIYFYGEVGIGKTALLYYLKQKLQDIAPTALIAFNTFIGFDCSCSNLATFLLEIVHELGSMNFPRFLAHLEQIRSRPVARLQRDLEIESLKLFQDECKVLAEARPIVLFFDDFEQVTRNSFGEWFIDHFSPNLVGPLIIFAGRFPLVRVPDTIEVNCLKGLGREDSKELLTRITGYTLNNAVLDELLARTGGNPRLLKMAARLLLPGKDIDWEQIARVLQRETEPSDVQETEFRPKTVIPYWEELIHQSRT